MATGSYTTPPNSDDAKNQHSLTVKVCYCYSHEDKTLRNELDNHLSTLKRLGRITTWYDREILPGTEWEHEINNRLGTANLILLLISASFVSSDYCWGKEMQQALEQHKAGTAHVIPIILRPVLWTGTPIGELQLLPTNGKPVTQWLDRDLAFKDVAEAISLVVSNLLIKLEEEARRRQLIQELQSQVEGLVNEASTRRSKIESLRTGITSRTKEKHSLQLKLVEIQGQIASLENETRQLQIGLNGTYTTEYESQQEYKRLVGQLITLAHRPGWIIKEYPAMLCPTCSTRMSVGSMTCSSCRWKYPGVRLTW